MSISIYREVCIIHIYIKISVRGLGGLGFFGVFVTCSLENTVIYDTSASAASKAPLFTILRARQPRKTLHKPCSEPPVRAKSLLRACSALSVHSKMLLQACLAPLARSKLLLQVCSTSPVRLKPLCTPNHEPLLRISYFPTGCTQRRL